MNIFAIFFSLTVMLESTRSQFLREDDENNENSVCGSGDCVIISRCPSVLKLVFKVLYHNLIVIHVFKINRFIKMSNQTPSIVI